LAHRVNSYSFGEIVIDGKAYHHDVIIFKEKILDWWRAESHNVSINDADQIVQLKPKAVIFGTGESGVMRVPRETLDYLKSLNIKVLMFRTGEAYQKYNDLAEEEAAAALHLTC
jgi:hypothetical protein